MRENCMDAVNSTLYCLGDELKTIKSMVKKARSLAELIMIERRLDHVYCSAIAFRDKGFMSEVNRTSDLVKLKKKVFSFDG
ncbi:MAG: hypothetical protein IKG34_10100 [Solobacterium sp.]|nr:hypothetical protein [Solobacterium sp.]